MNWMISLAQLLLSLSFLVAVHEMGHLLAAKYFGMRVEQFSIGFPPKIWSFKKGETEYAISAIPLGGYVKISGMIDESMDVETMKQDPQPWEFRSKPAWQRLIVMLGGIFVNVVIGILIFIGLIFVYGETFTLKDEVNKNGGFAVGEIGEAIGLKSGDKIIKINGADFNYVEEISNPQTLLSADGYYTVERDGKMVDVKYPADFIQKFNKREGLYDFVTVRIPVVIGDTIPGSIAEKAGLKRGDVITAVNGKPVKYYDELQKIMREDTSKVVTFAVVKDGKPHAYRATFGGDRKIGFHVFVPENYMESAKHVIKYSFLESIPVGTKKAFVTLITQITAFKMVITAKLSARESLSGPIGIMKAFGVEWDWYRFWSLTGVLSLVLAFMNLLPIPALDGGHVMFLTYEIVSRRKPSDKFLENAQKVGMVMLLSLMVFVFANDILKLFGL